MRRQYSILGLIIFFLIIYFILITLNSSLKKQISSIPITPSQTPLKTLTPSGSRCHARGVLPDPLCTPGSIDRNVNQENIQQTICKKNYTKTVRPSSAYIYKLKKIQIEEYGYTDKNPSNYEEDHLISLELGGSASDPANLWPEWGPIPNPKDAVENLCHRKVCREEITLERAQKEIAENWQTACQ